MKWWLALLAIVVATGSGLRADVTVTSTMTITGPVAAFMGGGTPQMVVRVKGNRGRMDVEVMGQKMSTLVDLDTRQVTTLMHAEKKAQVLDAADLAAKMPALDGMKMNGTVEPTGRTESVDGHHLTEYRYSMAIDLANMAGRAGAGNGNGSSPGLPPEAADMLKDVKVMLTGLMMVSKEGPGVAEYIAFTRSAQKSLVPFGPFSPAGTMGAPGVPGMPMMGDIMRIYSQLEGLPYQSQIETAFEGGGPMADMLKTMGAMTIVTKVSEVSTAAIPDDVFQVPADYTMSKQ
jgi:hypothetical protein